MTLDEGILYSRVFAKYAVASMRAAILSTLQKGSNFVALLFFKATKVGKDGFSSLARS
jgi:hypothetical protein